MYRKKGRSWTKHIDFMLLDVLCMQIAFIVSYICRFGLNNPYIDKDYRILAVAFLLIDFFVEIVSDAFKNVLKRGYLDEFIVTCKHVALVEIITTFFLFTTQMGEIYSRMSYYIMIPIYILVSYLGRMVLKKIIKKRGFASSKESLFVIAPEKLLRETLQGLKENGFGYTQIPKKMFSIKAAVPLIKYSWKVMMTDLLGTLCNNLGDFIIGAKYNSANLAYYTKGKQLPQLFRTNIYTTLISVLFPGIAAVNDNMITVKKITRKSVRIMAYIVFPISLGLMAAGDTIIEVLFTEKWLPMLPYVYVMCVETIISVPATIALQPIKAVGRSDLMLKSEIIKKIFFMISTVVAMNYGVFAIALTVPANTLLDLTINTIINKKIINYSIFEELSDCFTAFTLSLMMAAIVVFIGKIELNIYVKVVIQILTGVLSYAGVSYLTKNKEFIYILNVGIKHFKNV